MSNLYTLGGISTDDENEFLTALAEKFRLHRNGVCIMPQEEVDELLIAADKCIRPIAKRIATYRLRSNKRQKENIEDLTTILLIHAMKHFAEYNDGKGDQEFQRCTFETFLKKYSRTSYEEFMRTDGGINSGLSKDLYSVRKAVKEITEKKGWNHKNPTPEEIFETAGKYYRAVSIEGVRAALSFLEGTKELDEEDASYDEDLDSLADVGNKEATEAVISFLSDLSAYRQFILLTTFNHTGKGFDEYRYKELSHVKPFVRMCLEDKAALKHMTFPEGVEIALRQKNKADSYFDEVEVDPVYIMNQRNYLFHRFALALKEVGYDLDEMEYFLTHVFPKIADSFIEDLLKKYEA